MSRSSFDQAGNVCRKRVRIAANEQMDVIGLNSQFDHTPVVFFCHFLDDLFESITNWADQRFPSPLRTKDHVIHHQMDCMAFMCVFHVDTIPYNNRKGKHSPPIGAGFSSPAWKDRGFQARFLCNPSLEGWRTIMNSFLLAHKEDAHAERFALVKGNFASASSIFEGVGHLLLIKKGARLMQITRFEVEGKRPLASSLQCLQHATRAIGGEQVNGGFSKTKRS